MTNLYRIPSGNDAVYVDLNHVVSIGEITEIMVDNDVNHYRFILTLTNTKSICIEHCESSVLKARRDALISNMNGKSKKESVKLIGFECTILIMFILFVLSNLFSK